MSVFHSIGVSRHRIGSDGVGVTTLVAAHGCPLDCRYCLNPQCKRNKIYKSFTVEELYDTVVCDDLYFEATGGGVTFGGGEPLLFAEFIREFILYARSKGRAWRFSLETSLAVPVEKLCLLDGLVNEYIVDIKDMDPEIYLAYTNKSNEAVKMGLSHLASVGAAVRVRTPLIPGYNCENDVKSSQTALRSMGFNVFDSFTYRTDVKK